MINIIIIIITNVTRYTTTTTTTTTTSSSSSTMTSTISTSLKLCLKQQWPQLDYSILAPYVWLQWQGTAGD